MNDPHLTDWLPTTRKEMELRGWDEVDVVLFSGDAYVDHPSFGTAVVGRLLESEGLRVAIVPQPNWRDDLRDFKKMGRPRLFFAISAGCMDSMVNKYTTNKRLRHEDAYTPDGRHDKRPEYASIVYSHILRELYPDVPILLGGIEASMRRLTHYDYWQDSLRKSILCDSKADLVIYGMGEKPLKELCRLTREYKGVITRVSLRTLVCDMPQTVMLYDKSDIPEGINEKDIVLHSHEACLADKRKQAENVRHIEEESNKYYAQRIIQSVDGRYVVVNPPYPPMNSEELDHSFELPYTRLPHPKYKGKRIPAYEMIKFSVNLHRGCFGGCAFCTISAHQGKFIVSRSKESILREVEAITRMPDFKGYLSDLGGPSANMYAMQGKKIDLCQRCKRPSCIHPKICPNLQTDHSPLLDIYRSVDKLPCIKKSFVGSGVRYDLLLHKSGNENIDRAACEYTRELITNHVSGRLKVAPEHTGSRVLELMRKPDFEQFYEFKLIFDCINREEGLNQQIIPYFISSHPGCTEEDMAELAVITKSMDFHLEQVQDFTPTPMTISTETWYTGIHPYTLQPVYSARSAQEKLAQRMFFFWYKPEEKQKIVTALRKMGRNDLIGKLYPISIGKNTHKETQADKRTTFDHYHQTKRKTKQSFGTANSPNDGDIQSERKSIQYEGKGKRPHKELFPTERRRKYKKTLE